MDNENIRKLWEDFTEKYKEYLLSNEEKWIQKLNEVIKYIDKNHKKPTIGNKDKYINSLGLWIARQLSSHKQNNGIMKIKEIKNKKIDNLKRFFLLSDEKNIKTIIPIEIYAKCLKKKK